VLFYLAALLVLSSALSFLWNRVLAGAIHISKINYGQALGLLLLCRILFGRFNFPQWGGRRRGDDQQHLLKDKLMSMSEEDQASFKKEWQKRCENREKW